MRNFITFTIVLWAKLQQYCSVLLACAVESWSVAQLHGRMAFFDLSALQILHTVFCVTLYFVSNNFKVSDNSFQSTILNHCQVVGENFVVSYTKMQNDDQTKRKRKRNPNTNAICTVAKQKSRTAAICHSREKGLQSSLEYKVKNMYRKKRVWASKVWKMQIRVWSVSKLGLYAEDYTVLVQRNAENNSIFCQPIHRMLIGFFSSLSIATKQAKKRDSFRSAIYVWEWCG